MRVLVTLDGSELSEKALAVMAPWVRATGAHVLLLAVIDPEQVHATFDEGSRRRTAPPGTTGRLALRGIAAVPPVDVVEDRGQALEAARVETEELLRAKAAEYLAGQSWDVHVEWAKDAAETIARFAGEHGVDLVAMATHGRSGVGQALLGSVAASVVRHSPVPVLLVNERASVAAAS